MQNLNNLMQAVVEMEETQALELCQQYLDDGVDPQHIFETFQKAMAEVGNRFEQGVYFIPELIMSGEMMKTASEMIKPYIGDAESEKSKKLGKVLVATVEGDIHDIGKNIVVMMLDIAGFEVKDLGVDVPTAKIVAETKDFQPDIVGLSGLLTLAFDPMKDVVETLAAEGLRDKTKVLIGGAQLDDGVRAHTGADAWVTDAVAGVNYCKQWVS